jgi:hypothetical protein
MKRCFLYVVVAALITVMPLFAQEGRHNIDPDEAYKNNCMRCHTSTQQYSPRKTKTIVMHMRVRANLTQDEAEAILKYLTEDSSAPTAKGTKQSDLTASNNGRQITHSTR